MMKLYINFEHDPETGDEHPVITDDRGERLPCIRAVNVDFDFQEVTEVTIRLAVDRTNVLLGSARQVPNPPPDRDNVKT